jgi:peptidoglycan/xylan/chitin deacetylase (PgdA/CDA1 family)
LSSHLARKISKAVFAAGDLFVPSPRGPRILIYHQVGAGLGRQMEVTVDCFRRQLDWLVASCDVVDLQTALERWEESGSDRLVVVTFDDGYEDLYMKAYPMLKERDLPFILYLATESIEIGRPLGPSEGADPLTWRQVEEMLAAGLATVGAHTHRHPDLRSCDRERVVQEIGLSNELIESRLGVTPRSFAYPWGFWSETADLVVKGAYENAVLGGSPRPRATLERHRIHRYPVQLSDGFAFFKARMSGGLRLEEMTRRALNGYNGP